MADNINVTEGSGKVVAGDDVGGVLYQRVKLSVGADGSATDISSSTGATDSGTIRVVSASDTPEITNLGSLTETAPATDTASSGLNGRLQRVAQRITSLIALVPTSLGTKTAANSFAVTLASDDATVAVQGTTSGSAVITDANGTLQQYLRGIVKLLGTSGTIILGAGSAIIGKVGIDQTTPGTTNKVYLTDINAGSYETVAASATDQALGATGATGDYLAGVLIVPATTSPGAVSIKDGSGSAITIFAGGASSLASLVPFMVPLGIKSTGGAWKVTTGTNVQAIGVGNFT